MAKIHYDELTVGVPSKASSVNYENADGTKESVQSKISKIENDVGKSKQDIEGSQGRNLIPYPYSNISATANGLTREVLADGSIHIYGTATATTNTVVHGIGDRTPIANGTYTLSGCPKGGSNTTYRAFLNGNKDGVKVVTNLALDSGDGATFTIDDTMNEYSLAITVYNGTTVDLIYKPMLEEGTVAHAYEPTIESNVTLKQNIADLQKPYVDVLGGIKDITIDQFYTIDLSQYTELIIKISLSGTVKYAPLYWHKDMGYNDAYCISNYYSSAYCGSIEFQVRENGLFIPSAWTAVKYNNNTVTTFKVSVIGR